MAVATSETSARVGTGAVIMLSSIWVATITGLPAARQARVSRFWIGGTEVTGSSTPRSPRATMMPSEASRISAKASTAAGFSILERIAARPSASSRASKTSVGPLHEGERQPVDAELAGELQVLAVLGRERGERQHHVGHVDALAVGDLAADHHLGHGVLGRALDHLQADLAVVDEEGGADLERREDLRVRQADAGRRRRRPDRGRSGSARPPRASPGRRRRCRSAASAPAGRRGCRSAARPRPRPGGPARAAGRCRPGCRGSC